MKALTEDAVGVPVIRPSADSDSPSGSAPSEVSTDQARVFIAPIADRAKEYGRPTTASISWVVEIFSAPEASEIGRLARVLLPSSHSDTTWSVSTIRPM